MFEVLQGSARVLKNKKPRQTRGSANIRDGGGGGYNRMIFFCFQVDGLITRRAYKWRGLISGGGLITGVLRYCDIRTK